MDELKSEEFKEYGNLDRFSENRWIINEKIWEHLGFINNQLLPSVEAYLKIQWWAKIDERFSKTILWEVDISEVNRYSRPSSYSPNDDYIGIDHHMDEIGELLNASVDSEWNFDEGVFSTQQLFDTQNPKHAKLLESIGVSGKEVNVLNDDDIKIEQEAILYFMAMIGVHIWAETLGGVIGMVAWWWIDLYDAFSSEEQLLNNVKRLWLANEEFRMDKTWVDNVLAGIWLIPWATQVIKGSKLATFMKNLDGKAFEKATERVKEKLGLSEKIETQSIYEKFPFLEWEWYNEVREILWKDFWVDKLIWEGKNGIILKHPHDDTRVLKVAKWDDDVDNLLKEYDNQKEFYRWWRKLQKSWELEWLENFRIPEVIMNDKTDKIYEMEKVEWQNFRTLFYIDHYKEKLKEYNKKHISSMSDSQIESILEKKWLQLLPNSPKTREKLESTDAWWDFINAFNAYWNGKFWPSSWGNIKKFLDKMKSIWLYHDDDHAWNFMLDKNDNIYMIDFWQVIIPGKTKSKLFNNF